MVTDEVEAKQGVLRRATIIITVMNGKNVRVRFASSGQLAEPEHIAALAWPYFLAHLPAREVASDAVRAWFDRLLVLFVPDVDGLDELPAKTAFLFGFDPDAARATEANSAALSADSARTVLAEFADRVRAHPGPVRPEDFAAWMDEIKSATGINGEELFDPVRIALTGAHAGPDFDKLLLLIEDGSALGLGVPTVSERVERFVGV